MHPATHDILNGNQCDASLRPEVLSVSIHLELKIVPFSKQTYQKGALNAMPGTTAAPPLIPHCNTAQKS
eukprot:8270485-Ditylum_brightwellii.AAC.1